MLKDFKRACEFWGLVNKQYKQIFWELCQEYPDHVLKIDLYPVFKRERVWTKAGKPQKKDSANYMKAALDCLATYLGVDDRLFFNVSAEKIEGEQECCIIVIGFIKPMNVVDLLNTFKDTSESEPESIQ